MQLNSASSWLEVLRELQKDLRKTHRYLRPGSSDELIAELRLKAAEAGLYIADEYVEFLRVTNDFGWNGLLIYGYDPADEDVTLNDIFAVNAGVGYRFPDTIYGNDSGDHIVRSASDGKFRMIDGGSDIVIDEDESFLNLFVTIATRKLNA